MNPNSGQDKGLLIRLSKLSSRSQQQSWMCQIGEDSLSRSFFTSATGQQWADASSRWWAPSKPCSSVTSLGLVLNMRKSHLTSHGVYCSTTALVLDRACFPHIWWQTLVSPQRVKSPSSVTQGLSSCTGSQSSVGFHHPQCQNSQVWCVRDILMPLFAA